MRISVENKFYDWLLTSLLHNNHVDHDSNENRKGEN